MEQKLEDENLSEPMSSSYADGLSPYDNKGKLGLKEIFDSDEEVERKLNVLVEWVKEAKHVVFHTGAGISTSAGIPDFRGPQGVWTLEAKGEKPKFNKSFNEVTPTKTHLAIKHLIDHGFAKFVISQNIDGLHLRSGLSRHQFAELHGNMFTEQCDKCSGLYVRGSATTSVGCKYLGKSCPGKKGRMCRGKIKDTILDWEHNLPEDEICMAEWHSNLADLSITLGTTMQIVPSGNLPLLAKKRGGRLVVCNLQPTKQDKKADLIINTYVDNIMEGLMRLLDLEFQPFDPSADPTKKAASEIVPWDFPRPIFNSTKRLYMDKCTKVGKRSSSTNDNGVGKRKKKIKEEDAGKDNVEEKANFVKEECAVAIENGNVSEKTTNNIVCTEIKEEIIPF
ncbi:NAD-dependent protein deacetylase Sirt6 [Neocloeon triangulifer]|uniref:NAD-dependent protein deacetylase Sirt6 n=1 Tax=Neocloeon triangulifer TaxID=2078957 RepID=UPI00286F582D|nr:NAD-dependent protein deacetylase Sirt6 [Neocloeon triangulifer]